MSGKKKQAPSRKAGPSTLEGSEQAKRQAAVFLEVLAGLRTPTEACELLGLSLPRYYILETRGLQGMIQSLEPLPRGRRQTPEKQVQALVREKEALERELVRYQALVRAANRSIGLVAPKNSESRTKKKSGGKKKRKPRVRALKAIEVLRAQSTAEVELPPGGTASDGASGSAA